MISPGMRGKPISQAEKPVVPSDLGQATHPRILLVDDENDVRALNADVLIRSGYHVDTAENGAIAWKALQTNSYDLLITDNTMPEMTGLELIRQVRSADMTLSVILASGTVPAEELSRSPWLHVNALLPKPYSIGSLLRTVAEVLRKADLSP